MHKILLISDSHGERKRIQQVCKQHPHMDEYIHLGDLGFAPGCLAHFTIVRGNHDDASYHLPNEQILDIEDCKILLLHGHQLEMRAAYRLRSDDKIQSYETFMEWMEEESSTTSKTARLQCCLSWPYTFISGQGDRWCTNHQSGFFIL